MKVLFENPPHGIRSAAENLLDLTGLVPVFTFGDTIYNPHSAELDPSIFVHEAVHTKQQGDDPHAWWERYLRERQFRFDAELEAYREQYRFIKKHYKDRNAQARVLNAFAADLSGPMYGNLCSHQEALALIKA